jgi:hypothetical protein
MKSWNLYIICAIYVLLSLLIGEVHPFTKVPMYSNFPNWAYSFYLCDSSNTLLPIRNYFTCADDELSHQYSAICERLHINYGNQIETKVQLDSIGKVLFLFLKEKQINPLPMNRIKIKRVCYKIHQNQLSQVEVILFDGNWTN